MKQFNKNKALLELNLKKNKNTYIKRLSISLSCLFLLVCIILFTFAKFETSSDIFSLVNGTVKYCSVGKTYTFNYTSNVQEFKVECSGEYKIELWGAGGSSSNESAVYPANGGYTAGNIELNNSEKLYVYVGGNESIPGASYTFNGGGRGETSGGGATDIRLINGNWDNFDSLKSRIMVAGGGGGGFHINYISNHSPGHGGGLQGYNANANHTNSNLDPLLDKGLSGHGATQTSGGAGGTYRCANDAWSCDYTYKDGVFGKGGYGTINGNHHSSGGGGGYYGGGHGIHTGSGWSGGGGGSSFISGYGGSNAISSGSTSSNITHTNQSVHYSNKYFTNGVMIDGKGCNWSSGSPTNCGNNQIQPNGTNSTGHAGNGYARITYLGRITNCNAGQEWSFNYNGTTGSDGSIQTFNAPCNGEYKLEVWGAQGGNWSSSDINNFGGYSVGNTILTKGQNYYVAVGGKGANFESTNISNGGYNGGGNGGNGTQGGSAGGGATHIARVSGLLKDLESKKGTLSNNSYYLSSDILIVAAGAGGDSYQQSYHGAGAGGYVGNNGGYSTSYPEYYSLGATQIAAGHDNAEEGGYGSFGQGGTYFTKYGGNGGGGGFYGGGGSSRAHSGAGGGSSYIASYNLRSSRGITKHMTCYECSTSNDINTKTQTNTCHNQNPTPDCSKEGNGYAKITYLGK